MYYGVSMEYFSEKRGRCTKIKWDRIPLVTREGTRYYV